MAGITDVQKRNADSLRHSPCLAIRTAVCLGVSVDDLLALEPPRVPTTTSLLFPFNGVSLSPSLSLSPSTSPAPSPTLAFLRPGQSTPPPLLPNPTHRLSHVAGHLIKQPICRARGIVVDQWCGLTRNTLPDGCTNPEPPAEREEGDSPATTDAGMKR